MNGADHRRPARSVALQSGTAWHVMSAGDFNGDGKADILWQNDDGTAAVWLMDGTNIVVAAPMSASIRGRRGT